MVITQRRYWGHDSSAAIVQNGEVLVVAELKRISNATDAFGGIPQSNVLYALHYWRNTNVHSG